MSYSKLIKYLKYLEENDRPDTLEVAKKFRLDDNVEYILKVFQILSGVTENINIQELIKYAEKKKYTTTQLAILFNTKESIIKRLLKENGFVYNVKKVKKKKKKLTTLDTRDRFLFPLLDTYMTNEGIKSTGDGRAFIGEFFELKKSKVDGYINHAIAKNLLIPAKSRKLKRKTPTEEASEYIFSKKNIINRRKLLERT